MGESVLTAPGVADAAALLRDAGLVRDGGRLGMAGASLEAIAARIGTPAYVYAAEPIRARYRELASAFAEIPHRIHYAVKANSTLAVLGLLADLGAGADIVSVGELERVRRAGIPLDQVVFSGVGKTEAELEVAVASGLSSINLESTGELELLERVVAGTGAAAPARVGIRINPDLSPVTHPYITTGSTGTKFGVTPAEALAMASRIGANPRLVLTSLAMHLGSQLLDPAPYRDGAVRLLELRERLTGRSRETVSAIDLGGGFGIRYLDEQPLEPARLAAAIAPVLRGTGLELHVEPGRFLVGSAGVLLTRVLYRKRSGRKTFVVVDAAMNDLLRPSHYQARHAVVEVVERGRPSAPVDIVGPVCESGDFLAIDQELPGVEPGELLVVLCVGAYGYAMASNYNTRARPPEVMIDRGRFAIARPRETIDHLMWLERRDPFADEAP
ncbi:MAG: diaminopimelate decarboxylase [Gemmatimonadales bacterium]